jgi:hypothetical protein
MRYCLNKNKKAGPKNGRMRRMLSEKGANESLQKCTCPEKHGSLVAFWLFL